MSYRVLNVISGFLLSYSLHNGPDVIMEGGKEMAANTRRGLSVFRVSLHSSSILVVCVFNLITTLV